MTPVPPVLLAPPVPETPVDSPDPRVTPVPQDRWDHRVTLVLLAHKVTLVPLVLPVLRAMSAPSVLLAPPAVRVT